MKLFNIAPEFVDEIPGELDPGKLYVCCRYRAVKHLCACGCGIGVNTPLHPTGWTLICDGVSVSLWPSIGNWSEKCQSHYSFRNNEIHWASKQVKTQNTENQKSSRLGTRTILQWQHLFRNRSFYAERAAQSLILARLAHTSLRLDLAPQITCPIGQYLGKSGLDQEIQIRVKY